MIKSYKKLFISLSFIGLLLAPSISLAATKFPIDTGGTLTTGLVSYYKLGDTYDFYGSNNGTNNNGVTFSSGKVNNGANFVRASSKNIGISQPNSFGSAYSVSAWINPSSLPASNGNYHFAVGVESSGFGLTLLNSGGTQQVRSYHTNAAVNSDKGAAYNVSLTTGTWYHLVATWNGSVITLYLNGSSVATSSWSDIQTGGGTNSHIGSWIGASPSHFWDGSIDEVGIWSKALSTTEISDLYNGGNGQTMCTIGSDCPSGTTNPQMQIMWIDEY